MPISEEFHDLVGNPVPSGDLGQRARERAYTIRRQRLAGSVSAAVVVAVLAVPSVILARGSGQVAGTVGAGSATVKPSAAPAASAKPSESAEQAAKKAAYASLNGGTFQKPETTKLVTGPLTAADNARVAHAQQLLGAGLRSDAVQLEVDATTGERVGLIARFVAVSGGGTVGINWQPTAVERADVTGSPSIVGDIKKSEAAANDAKAGTHSPLVQVQGVSASNSKMTINMKVVQGSPGSDPILPGKAADTLIHALLESE